MNIEGGYLLQSGPASRAGWAGWGMRLTLCTGVSGGVVLGITAVDWNLRERVLLAVAVILAFAVGLLLMRQRLSSRRLEAEQRKLAVAVNNIPQGLVLYDVTARVVTCNQPYVDMFGLSPAIAKAGCTMQRLIRHRKETGSFDGDVDEFCNAVIRKVSLGKVTRQLTKIQVGRAIEIVNKPLPGGGWLATIEDVTARTLADEKIAHMAHYDALTDLPNRTQFRERLEQALKAIRPGEQLAVMYAAGRIMRSSRMRQTCCFRAV